MARVVQGVPTSWDPSIATMTFPGKISATSWSPCNKFIATVYHNSPGIVVLDAMTLEQLQTMLPPKQVQFELITLSPGSHLLTGYSWWNDCLISWDLQTGGLLSNINTPAHDKCSSVSYSECGTMIGGLFEGNRVIIYNVLSGTHIFSHKLSQPIVDKIWTDGEHLQFATVKPGSITIWQVSFTLTHGPTTVGTYSIPNGLPSKDLVLLPTPLLLASISDGKLLVWDVQNTKILLESAGVKNPRSISFSSDGHFFTCGSEGREFHVWKKSPTGYLSHQKLVAGAKGTTSLVSPSGESVASFGRQVLQLWQIEKSPTLLPDILGQPSSEGTFSLIEFSPDESLVAFTKRLSRRVTVVDLKSGNPHLVIETDTETSGLRITRDTVIVVGYGKIVTWKLPAGDCVSNAMRNTNYSSQTTILHPQCTNPYASISPNLNYLAIYQHYQIIIYNMHNGERLAVNKSKKCIPGFTPNNHKLWCAEVSGEVDQWEIVEENGPNAIRLEKLVGDPEQLSDFPWHSPCSYQVTDDGWILGSGGKRLIWLPYHWRQDSITQRRWSGKFLAIWNWNSLEPSILELKV